MSDKSIDISNDIFSRHKDIYKLSKFTIVLTIIMFSSIFINYINFFTGWHSFFLYFVSISIGVLSFIGVYSRSKKRNEKIKRIKVNNEMLNVFEIHNIKSEKQLLILKEEIENKLKAIDEKVLLTRKRVERIFFYLFWTPSGFLLAYYIGNSNETLSFNTMVDIIGSILIIFLQISILDLLILNLLNPIFNHYISDRNKYCKTLDYIYACLYRYYS
ncbi:hypothetical protein KXP56_000610 [Staphylococcus pseudintermedius]|nr:hypothetical protein [Staphylococcus pseudintermedius]